MRRAAPLAALILTALPWTMQAQQQQPSTPQPAPSRPTVPPPASKTGNPTPGTPQPDPPKLADRITVSGCLQLVPGAGSAPASAATTPANDRFILKDAKKDGAVPPDTGTSSIAAAAASASYRLEALESQLSPLVNTRVELSGEVKTPVETPPVLLVEFVRKIAPKCP